MQFDHTNRKFKDDGENLTYLLINRRSNQRDDLIPEFLQHSCDLDHNKCIVSCIIRPDHVPVHGNTRQKLGQICQHREYILRVHRNI